ncbi:MAG: AraC family transcriptional regulator [Oscillospiraceae bacterium]|nr:AraC family transcriptional regulator [Oscillospiraceae bacterium]
MQKYDYFLEPENIPPDAEIVIHNAGFSRCPPNYTYGWDSRDYYLIHYCISGKGTYFANDKEYSLGPGDGFLITPGSRIMHLSDVSEPWNLCWVGFRGERVAEYLAQARLDAENLIFRYTKDNLIETTIENIYDNIRFSDFSHLTLTGYLYVLLGALIDNAENKNSAKIAINHFEKAARYIKLNIRSPLTIPDLADELDISPSQMYRSFMEHCGTSPKQYLDRQKMLKACELMEKTDLSYSAISSYLGYEYETHFYQKFKKIMGITPSEHKKSTRKD